VLTLRLFACSFLPLLAGCSFSSANTRLPTTQSLSSDATPQGAEVIDATAPKVPLAESVVAVSAAEFPAIHQVESSSSQPTVKIQYRYYPVTGATAQNLRSEMTHLSPVTQGGRHFDANTDWYVRWSYRYAKTGTSCSMSQVSTQVDVTFTLPKWQPNANAPRSLVTQWSHYSAALQQHEDGHKNHGIAAGQAVLSTLSTMPAYSSCQALEAAANHAARQVIQQYNQKDVEYDRETGHGSTQGAVFPPSST
jgi:predicted secreted Zn-dependent protease